MILDSIIKDGKYVYYANANNKDWVKIDIGFGLNTPERERWSEWCINHGSNSRFLAGVGIYAFEDPHDAILFKLGCL